MQQVCFQSYKLEAGLESVKTAWIPVVIRRIQGKYVIFIS